MTFDEYMDSWWQQFLADHRDNDEWNANLMKQLDYKAADWLDEGETPKDFLAGLTESADDLYDKLFGFGRIVKVVDDLPDTNDFVKEMLEEAAERDIRKYGFVDRFTADMADEIENYNSPLEFFSDLQRHGCQSGMIGMLIYHSDCKDLYIQYIDDMEDFKQELDGEIGEPLINKEHLHHYTWICWVCYEELAYRIGRVLFPSDL